MIIRNITSENIVIAEIRSPIFAAAPLVLRPNVDVTIFNEDAERSPILLIHINAARILVVDTNTEPTSGTAVQNTLSPEQVGNDLAQWNANKIQDVDVSPTTPTDGQILSYNSGTTSWRPVDPSLAEDHLSSVTTNDTTPKFLDSAIVTDSSLTKTILNPSANEQIELAVDPTVIQEKSEKDQNNGYAGLDGSGKIGGSKQVYGSTSNTAAEGNDSRIPTQAENDASQGTNGSPSNANRFVTNSDPRNSDARTPTPHASSHVALSTDPITISESQVTNLTTDLSNKANTTHKHTGSDGTSKVLGTDIDSTGGTSGQVLTSNGLGVSTWTTTSGGGHVVEDEGSPLTQRPTLNFTGTGVTVIDTGSKTEVQIPGSSGHIIQDEGISLTQRTTLNFVGSAVSVVDTGTKTEVTISGSSQTYAKEFLTVTSPIADHTIVLSNTPVANSSHVSWNGLVLKEGISNDYTVLSNIITLDLAITLTVGDELQVAYSY